MNNTLYFWLGIISMLLGGWNILRYQQGYGLTASYFNWRAMVGIFGLLFKHTKLKNDNRPYLTGNNKSELLLYGIFYIVVGSVLIVTSI